MIQRYAAYGQVVPGKGLDFSGTDLRWTQMLWFWGLCFCGSSGGNQPYVSSSGWNRGLGVAWYRWVLCSCLTLLQSGSCFPWKSPVIPTVHVGGLPRTPSPGFSLVPLHLSSFLSCFPNLWDKWVVLGKGWVSGIKGKVYIAGIPWDVLHLLSLASAAFALPPPPMHESGQSPLSL
jgi:hypothetical protein